MMKTTMKRLGRTDAAEWRGTVTLDGRDVSNRCAAVFMGGERPVAVKLWTGSDGRAEYDPRLDRLRFVIRCGDITCRLRLRGGPDGS